MLVFCTLAVFLHIFPNFGEGKPLDLLVSHRSSDLCAESTGFTKHALLICVSIVNFIECIMENFMPRSNTDAKRDCVQ